MRTRSVDVTDEVRVSRESLTVYGTGREGPDQNGTLTGPIR